MRSVRTSLVVAITLLVGLLPATSSDAQTPPGQLPPAPATVSERVEGLPAAPLRAATADPGPTGEVSAPIEAPIPFSMLGLELPAGATAHFRTAPDGDAWSPWAEAEVLVAGPDGPASERTGAPAGREVTEVAWVGPTRWLQVTVEGAAVGDVDATFIDSAGLSTSEPVVDRADEDTGAEPEGSDRTLRATAAPRPPIISRSSWGADESLRNGSPSYAPGARYAVVHHTAGSNSYSRADAPAVVRGIYHYHTRTLGWDDIGYNFLVDRYGRVYEGRAGGMDRAVVGAHARGFNSGSFGVALLGEFTSVEAPDMAVGAVAAVIAWKFGVHGIATGGTVRVVSGGSDRYRAGTVVNLPPIVGHRDVGRTECPGNAYYGQFGLLRRSVELRTARTSAQVAAFSDIGDSVHAQAIERLAASGITLGCGSGRYCPHKRVSRAEAVTLLVRALGTRTGSGQRYADVPPGHTHAGSIAAATDAGFITGYPDGRFRPDRPLPREQMASIVAKAAGLKRVPGQHFNDVPWTSVHLANVNAIGQAGISVGCGGGNFCPRAKVNRGQMASLITRMLDRR